MNKKIIDWPTFIGALVLLLLVVVPLSVFPVQGKTIVLAANDFITQNFGVVYLVMGLAALVFLLFVTFSRYGKIKLGKQNEKPEFSTWSWAAMLFCAGIGSSILYWSVIEWAYYYQTPPFGIEPGTRDAIRWASTYGLFHWGPIAWAIYCLPALPIAYFLYIRKKPILKVSEACRPVFGKYVDGPFGKILDILFLFGLLGGAGTTLALGTPLIAAGIHDLTGLPENTLLRTFVLLFCTVIFATSSYTGLRKGIKYLSDLNVWLAFILITFVLIAGPTVFLFETTVSAVGRMLNNFFSMSTFTEPFNNLGPFKRTGFPESWTVFYWAWWLVYAPYMGLFVAKISRGRTIRQMIIGTILYGSIGCILFFGILGNYALYLYLSGQLNVVEILNASGAPAAILAVLHQLPLHNLVVFLFVVLAIIFLSTTFDSSSYILASVVQKRINDEPLRWNRLFWAFALSLLPLVLMYLGGLTTLQSASIVGGFPLIFIMGMLGVSFIKAVKSDEMKAAKKENPKLNKEAG